MINSQQSRLKPVTTLNRLLVELNKQDQQQQNLNNCQLSLKSQVINIFEFQFNEYGFGVCLALDKFPKLVYCMCQDKDDLESNTFQIVCYKNQKKNNEEFDYVSCLMEIDKDEVICSHYDGSLILYKNFKKRELKNSEDIYEIIKPFQQQSFNDMLQVIINIAYFSNKSEFLLRLEYFNAKTQILVFKKKPNSGDLLEKLRDYTFEDSNFIFRKYLKKQQILGGFIDKYTFGVIQKKNFEIELCLDCLKISEISDDIKELLKIDSEDCSLDHFDVTMYEGVFYIICVYRVRREQLLCSFTLDTKNQNSNIILNTSFTLESELGEVQSIFALTQGENTRFNYDVVVVYKHIVIAYKLYNLKEFKDCELIIKQKQESKITQFKRYHYQEIQQQIGKEIKKVGFHLLITYNNEMQQELIEYFNLLL